jgi:hypothetical protein
MMLYIISFVCCHGNICIELNDFNFHLYISLCMIVSITSMISEYANVMIF